VKILVTGVAGFIGSNLAKQLIVDGHEVFGADNFSNGRPENIPADVLFSELDLADPAAIEKLPPSMDLIYHLAGQASGENSFYEPIRDLNENTASTINMIRYGRDTGASRLIFSSSTSVYGHIAGEIVREDMICRPISCYGIAKLAAENYVNLFHDDLPAVVFRFSNTYGAGQNLDNLMQGMVSIYLAQALDTGHIQVKGSLDRFRDFIDISDVVRALILAGTADKAAGETMNLATGVKSTVNDVLLAIRDSMPGIDWHVEGSTLGDHNGYYADVSKLRTVLGFEAEIPLEQGCAQFVEWALSQRPSG
jgi:UDP-glucose 4-epimerase